MTVVRCRLPPVNIRCLQDISLLNETREKLEYIIYRMCKSYGLVLPHRYRRNARKDYPAFVKSRKHTEKKVREAVALSVFVSNLFRIQRRIFAVIFSMRYKFMACVA